MYPAECATRSRTQRTLQYPGRPVPLLADTPVWRRAGAGSPAHDAYAGARVVGPCGPRTHARHAGGRWHGAPEPRRKGAGSRSAAEAPGRRGTRWRSDPTELQVAHVGVHVRREPGPPHAPDVYEVTSTPSASAPTWASCSPSAARMNRRQTISAFSWQRRRAMIPESRCASGSGWSMPPAGKLSSGFCRRIPVMARVSSN